MINEWDKEWQLIPSVNFADTVPGLGPLAFNELISAGTTPLGIVLLDSAKCAGGSARRLTRRNLAQADGELTYRKFKTGYVIELNAQLWETPEQPACDGVLRELSDLLAGYLEACANNDAQLVWQPSAWPVDGPLPNPRLLDQARSMGPSGNDASGSGFVSVTTQRDEGSPLVDVTFAFLSPFPYVTDYMNWPASPDEIVSFATEPSPGLHMQAPDANVIIPNLGTAEYFPVLRIHGPTSYCAIVNESVVDEIGNPIKIVYDGSQRGAFDIPAHSYVEIDCFHSTARLIYGSGAGTANAKAGIDVLNTDFFGLAPGDNHLFVNKAIDLSNPFYAGNGVDVIYRNAWA